MISADDLLRRLDECIWSEDRHHDAGRKLVADRDTDSLVPESNVLQNVITFIRSCFFSRTTSSSCWVCRTEVKTPCDDLLSTIHQDTLGGAWSFPACETCRSKRATVPSRVADVVVLARTNGVILPDEGDWELQQEHLLSLKAMYSRCDADGTSFGRPIHVSHVGQYHTVSEWLTTEEHKAQLETAKARYVEWFQTKSS